MTAIQRYGMIFTMALACVGFADEPANDKELIDPEKDKQFQAWVDPVLHWERPTVKPEHNAWPILVKAAKASVAFTQPEFGDLMFAGEYEKALPTGEELKKLKQWLKQNEKAMSLLSQTAKRPACLSPIDIDYKLIGQLRNVYSAAIISARLDAQAGRHQQAVKRLLEVKRVGYLVRQSQGPLLYAIIALSFERQSVGHLQKMVSQQVLPESLCQTIMDKVGQTQGHHHAVANSWRCEFWRYYVADVQHMRLLEQSGHPQLAMEWFHKLVVDDMFSVDINDLQLPAIPGKPGEGRFDRLMRANHVQLVDLEKTIRGGSRYFSQLTSNALAKWPVDKPIKGEDRPWFELVKSKRKEARKIIQPVTKLMKQEGDAKAKIDKQALANCLGEASAVNCSSIVAFRFRWLNCSAMSEDAALTITAAFQIYKRKVGRWPTSLDELVKAGIFKAVPTDPFGDGPLRYDAKRGVVWSVGENRRDDQAKEGSDDLVTRVIVLEQ